MKLQSQESLKKQLEELANLANEHGLYDAAAWVRSQARQEWYWVPHPVLLDKLFRGEEK